MTPEQQAIIERLERLDIGTPEDHDCSTEWDQGWFVGRRNVIRYLRGGCAAPGPKEATP